MRAGGYIYSGTWFRFTLYSYKPTVDARCRCLNIADDYDDDIKGPTDEFLTDNIITRALYWCWASMNAIRRVRYRTRLDSVTRGTVFCFWKSTFVYTVLLTFWRFFFYFCVHLYPNTGDLYVTCITSYSKENTKV